MPRVSRRFHEACRDPTLWPQLDVVHSQFWTDALWQSFLRWLATVASGLHSFLLDEDMVGLSPAQWYSCLLSASLICEIYAHINAHIMLLPLILSMTLAGVY